MIGVIQRYKFYILILCLLILFAVSWFIFSKQNVKRIPSRGVFVIKTVNTFSAGGK